MKNFKRNGDKTQTRDKKRWRGRKIHGKGADKAERYTDREKEKPLGLIRLAGYGEGPVTLLGSSGRLQERGKINIDMRGLQACIF